MSVYEKFDLGIKIEEKKSEIIEAFVQVYGEKYRELIESRINAIKVVSYVTAEDFEEYCKELEKTEIGSIKDDYREEFDERDKNYKLRIQIKQEYDTKLCEAVASYLPTEIQSEIKDHPYYIQNYLMKCGYPDRIDFVTGEFAKYYNEVDYISPIESFASKYNEMLKDNPNSNESTNIKEKRIKFFKKNGVDLGDDYEKYLEEERSKKIFPSVEVADKISGLKRTLNNEAIEKYIQRTGSYSEDHKKINELGYEFLQENYDLDVIYSKGACMAPFLVKNEGRVSSLPIIYLPAFELLKGDRKWGKYSDVAMIHEIGHAIEFEQIGDEENGFMHKTGLDIWNVEYQNSNSTLNVESREKRKCEEINEAIHQMLSIEVTEVLHSKGIYINEDAQKNLTKNSMPEYEFVFKIVKPFFDEFRGQMIDAIMSYENFEQLESIPIYDQFLRINELCEECEKMYSDRLRADTYANRNTPETTRYYEMIQESEKITNQAKIMQELTTQMKTLSYSDIKKAESEITQYITQESNKGENSR